jgi:hypothetical protein
MKFRSELLFWEYSVTDTMNLAFATKFHSERSVRTKELPFWEYSVTDTMDLAFTTKFRSEHLVRTKLPHSILCEAWLRLYSILGIRYKIS